MKHAHRILVATLTFASATLLFGCPGPAESCGEPESIDNQGCSGPALAALVREGVWHGQVTGDGGVIQRSFIAFSSDGGTPLVQGRAATESAFENDFFLATEFVAQQNLRVRLAYHGCTTPAPGVVEGIYQQCNNGELRAQGNFQLKRVGRVPGEEEAEGLEKVGEVRISQGKALSIAVDGPRAYVAAELGGLSIVDISNPAEPEVEAQMTGQNEAWLDVEIFEDILYVAGDPFGVRAYQLGTSALIPPGPIATQPAQAVPVISMTVDPVSRRLLANSVFGEVLIFNINNPEAPVLIGSFVPGNLSSFPGSFPRASVQLGDRLYAAFGPMGVVIADVSQASAPSQLADPFPATAGTVSTGLQVIEAASSVLAYETTEGFGGHLRVLDVTSPATVTVVSEYQTRPEVSATQVVVHDGKAYLAYYQDGVRILDLADPRNPTLAAYYNTYDDTAAGAGTAFADGVTAVEPARDGSGLVYVADRVRGLLILREQP